MIIRLYGLRVDRESIVQYVIEILDSGFLHAADLRTVVRSVKIAPVQEWFQQNKPDLLLKWKRAELPAGLKKGSKMISAEAEVFSTEIEHTEFPGLLEQLENTFGLRFSEWNKRGNVAS